MLRRILILIHRYAGLYMAFFLIVAGLTGSILAFHQPLDHWLNPEDYEDYYQIPMQAKPLIDPFELRERALVHEPGARCDILHAHSGRDKIFTLDCSVPKGTNEEYEAKKISLNPYSGERIHTSLPNKQYAECHWPLTRKNIMDCTFLLHFTLLWDLPGTIIFGITALVWTFDCFVGFYLTLPRRRKKKTSISKREGTGAETLNTQFRLNPPNPSGTDSIPVSTLPPFLAVVRRGEAVKDFWQRWQVAWKVKWPSSAIRLNFDLHRAGGLWFWPFLFIFAWSSVLFNLNDEIYNPVMKRLFETSEFFSPSEATPDLPQPLYHPPIDFRGAYAIGKRLMAKEARRKGFTVTSENWRLSYVDSKGLYSYQAQTNLFVTLEPPLVGLWLDATSGALKGLELMTGEKSGDTIFLWLVSLHMATVGGLPYRMFVSVMGLVISMLSITGVYIWFKKRRAVKIKRNIITSVANLSGQDN